MDLPLPRDSSSLPPGNPTPDDRPTPRARSRVWLLTLLGWLWVPAWLVLQAGQFLIGVARYLVLDRVVGPLTGRVPRVPESPLKRASVLLLCVLLAPLVVLGLLVVGVFRSLGGLLIAIGRWQIGPTRRLEDAETPAEARARLRHRQIVGFVAGALWVAVLVVTLLVLFRPLDLYIQLTGANPADSSFYFRPESDLDAAGPLTDRVPPWWFRGWDYRFNVPDVYFPLGLATLAGLLLVRWPGASTSRYGVPAIQFAARLLVVLAAAAITLLWPMDASAYDHLKHGVPPTAVPGIDLTLQIAAAVLAGLGVLALFTVLGRRLATHGGATPELVPFLAWRLLERKLIAFFAVGAIALCSAMVLIVFSIMGGFLNFIETKSHAMLGDLVIDSGTETGFAGYEEFLPKLRAHPAVLEATPVIYALGLMRIPEREVMKMVKVVGIDIAGKDKVTNFSDGLHYGKKEKEEGQREPLTFDIGKHIRDLPEGEKPIGTIIGTDTIFRRLPDGSYNRHFLPRFSRLFVTLFPMTRLGQVLQPSTYTAAYVDDHLTGVHDIDSEQLYLDFGFMQKALYMQATPAGVDEFGLDIPAGRSRASQVQIRLNSGDQRFADQATIMRVRDEIQDMWDRHSEQENLANPYVRVLAWDEINKGLINATRKEKVMVTTLFSMISLVSVALVFTLLYLIVLDKTRDVGVIKSVGGSDGAVAAIFLAYGAVIGVVGASLGLTMGISFVTNVNQVQDFLASLHPDLRIWDPSVYTFESIPDTVEPINALAVFIAAVLASVLGAVVPALKASNMQPVESLRYE